MLLPCPWKEPNCLQCHLPHLQHHLLASCISNKLDSGVLDLKPNTLLGRVLQGYYIPTSRKGFYQSNDQKVFLTMSELKKKKTASFNVKFILPIDGHFHGRSVSLLDTKSLKLVCDFADLLPTRFMKCCSGGMHECRA